MSIDLAFAQLATWEVPDVAAAVVPAGGEPLTHGDVHRVLRVASVGKMLGGYAIMIGAEEGAVTLDDPAGPPGSTLRHLLAHASGYGGESDAGTESLPGACRGYSKRGVEEAPAHHERAPARLCPDYIGEHVRPWLDIGASDPRGSPAYALHSTVADLVSFVRELQ